MPSGAYRRHRKATLADRRAAHASMSAAMRQVRLAEDWDALLDAVQCTEDAFVYGTEAIVVQAGESFVFPVKIATRTARISYAFAVKEFDVEVSAAVSPDGVVEPADPGSGPKGSDPHGGIPVTRLEAGAWLRGTLTPGRAALCEFNLSNEYSFFRSKEVTFQIRVHDDIETVKRWRGLVKAFREAACSRDRSVSSSAPSESTPSQSRALRLRAHSSGLSTLDVLQGDLQKMATDPCTRCLRSSVRAEVFVTRSMLAVARRGWELRAPLLPVFLHEALFLPADLHPAMARARGRAEAAKMHVVLAVAGRGGTAGAAGGALVTAGTAWHALKFLHRRGLLATQEAEATAAEAVGLDANAGQPAASPLMDALKQLHADRTRIAKQYQQQRQRQSSDAEADAAAAAALIGVGAGMEGGHMSLSAATAGGTASAEKPAAPDDRVIFAEQSTIGSNASPGDRALIALTNIVCASLRIEARPLAILFLSLVETLQGMSRRRASSSLLPCLVQGQALHLLSVLDAAGYAAGSLSLPLKVMECVAAALAYTALATSLEPRDGQAVLSAQSRELAGLVGLEFGGGGGGGSAGDAASGSAEEHASNIGRGASGSAATAGTESSAKLQRLVARVSASPQSFVGDVVYSELQSVHMRALRPAVLSKSMLVSGDAGASGGGGGGAGTGGENTNVAGGESGTVARCGGRMIARSLTLMLMDPVAAIPAVLLFRLSAGARGKSGGSLPDTSMLRAGSPKPVILAGGRAFLGSSVASVIPNAGLGEATTVAAAGAAAAAAAAAAVTVSE